MKTNDNQLGDLKQCQQELDRAWRQCNQEKHKSSHHRATHTHGIATRRENKNKTKAVNEIKSLQHQEEQRTQSRITKCTSKKQKDASFSCVTTTLPDGTTIEHHDKVDIKQALCKENERKHQLVHQTPIANSPSKEDFGLDGPTQETVNAAEGTYTAPATVDKGIQEWTQSMKKKTSKIRCEPNATHEIT